jgi:hypothetical protein
MKISPNVFERLKVLIDQKLSIRGKYSPLHKSKDLFEVIVKSIGEILYLDENPNGSSLYDKETDPYIVHIHEQLYQAYRHICMESSIGPYPFDASIKFLDEVHNFLIILESDKLLSPTDIANFEGHQKHLKELKEEENELMRRITKDPVKLYHEYRQKLSGQPNNPFPEFKGKIEFLRIIADDESIVEKCSKSKYLTAMRKNALQKFEEVVTKGYPYLDTVNAIEQFLAFIDVCQRGSPDLRCSSPLYHSRRWQYHSHQMKGEVGAKELPYILLPTVSDLGIAELLKTSGIPMGFVGIQIDPSYVDGHWQTSLEFWFHDINHSRRMYEQQISLAKHYGMTLSAYISQCSQYVKEKITPMLSISSKLTEEEKNIKRILKVILFEILHEDALPADPEVIQQSLSRPPYGKSFYFVNELQSEGKVYYSTDPNASVLSFVYRKLAGDFYDSPQRRILGLGSSESRTRAMVFNAAKYLVDALDLEIPADVLETNVGDDSGLPQGFRKHIIELLERDPTCMPPLNEAAARGALGFNEAHNPVAMEQGAKLFTFFKAPATQHQTVEIDIVPKYVSTTL